MRNRAALLIGLASITLTAVLLEAQTSNPKESEDVERLKSTYLQKRTDALKPVNSWYETQLEALRKKLTQKGDLDGALRVRDELQALRDGTTFDSEKEFKKALLASTWSWTGNPNDKGVEMTFRDTPTVSHIGMATTWKVTGPREVTLGEKEGETRVLRFDPKVTEYRATDGSISGRRWK